MKISSGKFPITVNESYFNRSKALTYMLVFLGSSVICLCLAYNSSSGSELFEGINIPDVFRMPHFSINIYVMTGLDYDNAWQDLKN